MSSNINTNVNATAGMKIILTRSEDWENWFWQLQANVSDKIWPYINPDGPERALCAEPRCPQPKDIDPAAHTYAMLAVANQHTFENARRFYNLDMKYYSRQRDQLQVARAYITATVSHAKKTALDPQLSVREWLIRLKQDTQPPKGYMIMQTETRYNDTLKSFKSNKLHQWLDEWEAIMTECIKYELPEIQNGRWLRDLAQRIRPMSEVYYVQFMKDARDDDKADPQEFREVARELREMLAPKGGRTMRGSAFHASFGTTESSDEGSDAKGTKQTGQGPPNSNKGHKRAGSQSIEANASKKEVTECPACGMRGHSLAEYWCIFEELRPQGMRSSGYRVRKAKKAVKKNEELKVQVEEIYKKMKADKATCKKKKE
jgi:hypothetical protein